MQSLVPGITIITVLSLFVIAGVLVKYFSPKDREREENDIGGTDFQSNDSEVSRAVKRLRSSQGEFSYENLLSRYQMTDSELRQNFNRIDDESNLHYSSLKKDLRKNEIIAQRNRYINEQNSRRFNEWKLKNLSQLDRSISLRDLLNNMAIEDITYGQLLQCHQWRFKRLQVLIRDNYQCQHCNEASESNHVHHTMYILDELPWEIEDHKLQTLCLECHKEVHRNESIPVVEIENGIERITNRENPQCYKCGGIGYIHEFKHRDDGICYACMGKSISLGVFIKALTRYKNHGSLADVLGGRTLYQSYFRSFTLKKFNNLDIYQDKVNYNRGYIEYDEEDDLPF